MYLNYRYRLYPTEAQACHLGAAMRKMRRGWNEMVRYSSRSYHHPSRLSKIRAQVAKWQIERLSVGMRAKKLGDLQAQGMSASDAVFALNKAQVEKIHRTHRASLSVDYGKLRVDLARRQSAGSDLGSAWSQLGIKYSNSWSAAWQKKRGRPRKKRTGDALWIQSQVQVSSNSSIVPERRNGCNENWINLSFFFKSKLRRDKQLVLVKMIEHRRLPIDAVIKDIKVTRSSVASTSKWHVVLAISLPDNHPLAQKRHPSTGHACGIDPGVKTAFTCAGTDISNPGIDGFEIDPGKPFQQAKKQLAKLQRKLDRQTRANNPHCYDANGVWKNGATIKIRSKNMMETASKIRELHEGAANIRKDCYQKAAKELFDRYDTVYVGTWTDASPSQRSIRKKKRKATWEATGEQRPKGVAKLESTIAQRMRDNAPGLFRSMLCERASRSKTPKESIETNERKTTVKCVGCGLETGPSGLRGLTEREWTCKNCGKFQLRDRGSAWNILQVGESSQAARQAVKVGSPKTHVARSSTRKRDKGASAASNGNGP